MIFSSFSDWLPFLFIFGYAEIHYRMKYFFSFLSYKQPEIIFDLPTRVKFGKELPVFLIINDAHQFAVSISNIKIKAVHESGFEQIFSFSVKNRLTDRYVDLTFPILLEKTGIWYLTPSVWIEINKKKILISVDNYKKTNKLPLKVFVSNDLFPKYNNQFSGDLHYHSRYTFDQVEFGAGLTITKKCMSAIDLDFLCVTDHSYDLDDEPNNYLTNTHDFPKWKQLLNEVNELNKEPNHLLIPGFELSTGNKKEKNVHLLFLGQRRFIIGKGDGAEKWFKTKPDKTIEEALELKDEQAVTYAAHPFEVIDWLQQKLLGRGNYSLNDISSGKLSLQILNGIIDDTFQKSKRIWISLLQKGNKISIGAGNDAHGNFNRFRQIAIPFFTMKEMDHQVFGRFRTIVQAENLTEKNILNALRFGNSYLTNGFAIDLTNKNKTIKFGESYYFDDIENLTINLKSTEEFGKISTINIYWGLSEKEVTTNFQIDDLTGQTRLVMPNNLKEVPLYFRVEATGSKSYLISNPIYLK